MTLLAGLYGSLAALAGSLIWAGITYATGYQIGWMAIGVGALVGVGVRLGEGEGKATALFAGGLSIVAMLFGNVMAIQITLDRFVTEATNEMASREAYEEEFAIADEFVLYTTEENYAEFVFENTYYTEADSAEGVTKEEIDLFLAEYAPELRRLHEERPAFDTWKARKVSYFRDSVMGNANVTQFVLEDIGVVGVVFMILGMVAAMQIVGEWN